MVERDLVGGAAHLWDCIPSKTMIATGGAMSFARRIQGMGLDVMQPHIDREALRDRVVGIENRLSSSITEQLTSQGVRIIKGTATLDGPNTVVSVSADGQTERLQADAILIATGTRPRVPEWCQPDGERILTTRHCYPPKEIPEHLIVIGSGVTGVEFVHMFSSIGS